MITLPGPWVYQAACVGCDPELWFGHSTTEAVAICHTCPVRSQCLAYALDSEANYGHRLRHGVFGGATPTQRARLRRRPR